MNDRYSLLKDLIGEYNHDERLEVDDILSEIRDEYKILEMDFYGHISKVYKMTRNDKKYILKISKGYYRIAELFNEHNIMRELFRYSQVNVTDSIRFTKKGEVAYQIQEFVEGRTLRSMIKDASKEIIKSTFFELGKELRKLHDIDVDKNWNECILNNLKLAKLNLEHGHLDISEFDGEASPKELYGWLLDNIPKEAKTSIVHGDLRTKNIMVKPGMTTLIDWGFADYSDAYYDLAVLDYYMDDEVKKSFYGGYGLKCVDEGRLRYFEVLSKFINV